MDIRPAGTDAAPDFLSDCRLMLRFARKMGTRLSPELEHQVALLDSLLKLQDLPPISSVPAMLVPDIAPTVPSSITVPELVLRVHGELSAVVAPATALSLQTSEPPPGRHTFVGGMPLIVKWAAALALLSAVGFVVSAAYITLTDQQADTLKAKESRDTAAAAGAPPAGR